MTKTNRAASWLAASLLLAPLACSDEASNDPVIPDAGTNSGANNSTNGCPTREAECNGSIATTYLSDDSTGTCTLTPQTQDCAAMGLACEAGMCVSPDAAAGESCDDTPAPERCDEDATTYTGWGPASVVDALSLVPASDCCFDLNGQGGVDNKLGSALELAGGSPDIDFDLATANESLAEAIADGTIAIVLEHEGFTNTDGQTFDVNFLFGSRDPAGAPEPAPAMNAYLINPMSFEKGAFAQARVLGATLDGSMVEGGPGTVALALSFFGIDLSLQIFAARFSAMVDPATDLSEGGTGVALNDGKLGGAVRVTDLYDALNDFADANCSCVALPAGADDLVVRNATDPVKAACVMGVDANACRPLPPQADFDALTPEEQEARSLEANCRTVATTGCGFVGLIGNLPDVNSLAPGEPCMVSGSENRCDSISLGLRFGAAGASIAGVGEAATP